MTVHRRAVVAAALAIVTCAVVLAPATAHRAAPSRLVYRCTLETTKVGTQITVTLRLRTNGPLDAWRIRLFHDGELIFKRVRSTNQRGNLTVVRIEPNLPGRDRFLARTRHIDSENRCIVDAEI